MAASQRVQRYRILNRCRSYGADRGSRQRGYRDSAPTEPPTRRHADAVSGTIGAVRMLLITVTNNVATQYPSHSLTTGLIAGSDLVIVLLSGVIKKYK